MKCLFFALFFISRIHDFHVDAESMIVKMRGTTINICRYSVYLILRRENSSLTEELSRSKILREYLSIFIDHILNHNKTAKMNFKICAVKLGRTQGHVFFCLFFLFFFCSFYCVLTF